MRNSPVPFRPTSRRFAGEGWHAAGALGWLALGLWGLWQHHQEIEPIAARPAMAVLLMLLSGLQLRIVWARRHATQTIVSRMGLPAGLMVRWGFLCAVAGYALLVLPARPAAAPWMLAAWLSGLHSVWLLTTCLAGSQVQRLTGWLGHPVVHRAGQVATLLIVALLACELALRADGLLRNHRQLAARASHRLKLPAGVQRAGRRVNALGYWDQEFEPRPRPGRFRIAVLGDERTLSGTDETNFLADAERRLPGVEIYHFGLAAAGPIHYVAQLANEVLDFQPGLILVCVALDDDITAPRAVPSCAEWQGLRLWDWARRCLPGEVAREQGEKCEPVRRDGAQRLAICRSPIETALRPRWQATFRALDTLAQDCRQRQLPLALVLIPAGFQIDPVVCEHLRHQAGYTLRELDLELPQRRLTAFAQQRQVAVLDLLPHLSGHADLVDAADGSAWNDAGHHCAAEALARWIHVQYGPRLSAYVQSTTSAAAQRSSLP